MLDWFLNVSQDDDVTTTTKPKRRWLRFSLRTLLIFMLVVCVAVGWKFERVRKQRVAVAWVQEMGGTVYYEPHGPGWPRWNGGSKGGCGGNWWGKGMVQHRFVQATRSM